MNNKLKLIEDLHKEVLLYEIDKEVAVGSYHKQGYAIYKGVYFLYSGNDLVYIGKSNNIICRISSHHYKKEIVFETVRFMIVESEVERSLLEYRYIKKYKPAYNKTNRTAKNVWKKLAPQVAKEDRDHKRLKRMLSKVFKRQLSEVVASNPSPKTIKDFIDQFEEKLQFGNEKLLSNERSISIKDLQVT